MEKDFLHVSDRKLREAMAPLRDRFRLNRDTEEDRHLSFAIVREVAARAVGLRPYREQIAGALALEAGCVAEMATGEGKTLAATMPAVLAGWRGRGCHVVTANEYLAQRDAEAARAEREQARLRAEVVVPADANRESILIAAEAEREREAAARRAAEARLAELERSLPEGVEIHVSYDRSRLIERAIATLMRATSRPAPLTKSR